MVRELVLSTVVDILTGSKGSFLCEFEHSLVTLPPFRGSV